MTESDPGDEQPEHDVLLYAQADYVVRHAMRPGTLVSIAGRVYRIVCWPNNATVTVSPFRPKARSAYSAWALLRENDTRKRRPAA